jgi:hypothetical protein
MSGVPDLNAQIANGQFQSAMTSFTQGVLDNGTAQEAMLNSFYEGMLHASGDAQKIGVEDAIETFKGYTEATGALDDALAATDAGAVIYSSSSFSAGENWSAIVIPSKVTITPATVICPDDGGTVPLQAAPGTPGDVTAPFVYNWNLTGNAKGTLEQDDGNGKSGTYFDTTSCQETYLQSGTPPAAGAEDQVIVTVYENTGTLTNPIRGTLVGTATGTMTFSGPCGALPPPNIENPGRLTGLTLSKQVFGANMPITVTASQPAQTGSGLQKGYWFFSIALPNNTGVTGEWTAVDGNALNPPIKIDWRNSGSFGTTFTFDNPYAAQTHSATFVLYTVPDQLQCSASVGVQPQLDGSGFVYFDLLPGTTDPP